LTTIRVHRLGCSSNRGTRDSIAPRRQCSPANRRSANPSLVTPAAIGCHRQLPVGFLQRLAEQGAALLNRPEDALARASSRLAESERDSRTGRLAIPLGRIDSARGSTTGRPYSQDLRERVIAAVDLGGRVYDSPGFPGQRVVHLQGARAPAGDWRDDRAEGTGGPQARACGP
jgi:hypothetical protein